MVTSEFWQEKGSEERIKSADPHIAIPQQKETRKSLEFYESPSTLEGEVMFKAATNQ
jgi:hypothetical protein